MLLPFGRYGWWAAFAVGFGFWLLPFGAVRAQTLYLTQPWSYSVNYTFGRGTTNPGPPMVGATSDLAYNPGECPLADQYAITNKVDCPGLTVPKMKVGGYEIGSTWYFGSGLLNDEPPGYMLLASYHPSTSPKILWQKTVNGLCSGRDYLFWAAIRNLLPNATCYYPNYSFTVETTSGVPIASFPTGNLLGPGDMASWYFGWYYTQVGPVVPFYGGTFTLPAGVTDIVLKIVINPSAAMSVCVANVAIDNIILQPMGPSVIASIPGQPSNFLAGACFLGNVPLTLDATVGNGYKKFGTPDSVVSVFANPAVQWQQSLDEGFTWQDIPGETNLHLSHVFNQPDTFYVRLRAADAIEIGNLYCNVVSNVIKVDVDSIPAGLVFATNSPVCEDSDVVFNLSGAANYLISGPNGFSDDNPKAHIFHPSLKDSGWYHILATSFGGCPIEDSTHVVIRGPTVTVSDDATVCYGDPVQLRATGGSRYVWSPAIGLSNDSVAVPIALPPKTTKYTVKVSDGSGCSAFANVTITLRDSVLRAAFAGPDVACPRDVVQFLDSSVGKIAVWRWELGEGEVFEGKAPPALTYPRVGEYAIRLMVTDSAGCADTVAAVMKSVPNCFIAVPGAFSPNGDGTNDYLYPLDAYKAKNLVFRVFNREGEMVWETRDWTKKWDGRVAGRLAPPGVVGGPRQYTGEKGKGGALNGTTVLV
jgi:gliding motility-associated-like protein